LAIVTKILRHLALPLLFLKDNPILYKNQRFTIVGFGLFAALETFSVLLLFWWFLAVKNANPHHIPLRYFVLGAAMVWLGAKVFHWFALGRKFFKNPLKYISETGFYMQGGVIGALCWLVVLAHTQSISFTLVADALCWAGLAGQCIGRFGCFNYGCCFGKPMKNGPGVRYCNKHSKVLRMHPELHGVKLHATQLYMAFLDLALFITCWYLLPVLPSGSIFLFYFFWQGVTRVVIEFFRFDLTYDEGRNYTTYYTAIAFALSPIAFALLLHYLDPYFWVVVPLGGAPTAASFIGYYGENPLFIIIAFIVSLAIFFGYGIHGARPGVFPRLFRKPDEQPLRPVPLRVEQRDL